MPLADTQITRRIKTRTVLNKGMNHLETQCFCQFAQLIERGFKLNITYRGHMDGSNNGVPGLIFDFSLHAGIASFLDKAR